MEQTIIVPEVISMPTISDRKLYFDNNAVEDLLLKYQWKRCTEVNLRDQIMAHANELIRQIILANGLHRIYPGHEESAIGDLSQTAWIQIEKTLYKYKARPHCAKCYNPLRPQDSALYDPPVEEYGILRPKTVALMQLKCPICNEIATTICYRGTSKVFNMWSQVARTVILAFIKKEGRDNKNADAYKNYLGARSDTSNILSIDRFIGEATEMCQFNPGYVEIIKALKTISKSDIKPHEGIVSKLVKESRQSRALVTNFLKLVRLRQHDFSDSPSADTVEPRNSAYAECE